MIYDLIIIGAGPAALTASIYASRYKLSHLVIGQKLGGELALAHRIENFPGFISISGRELMLKIKEQVENLGAKILFRQVEKATKLKNGNFQINLNSQEFYQAKALIVAAGGERRRLNIKGEKEYLGKGISYCTDCDAPFFKNKTVVIIGGSDAAVSGAVHLSKFALKIYLIYRGQALRAEPLWQDEWQKIVKAGQGKTIFQTNVIEVVGDGQKITGVKLDNNYQNKQILPTDGLFVEIGSVPGTALTQSLGAKIDEAGYVLVNDEMETNVSGLFCAGDMTSKSAKVKQAIIAAGQGAMAAASSYKFIKKSAAPRILGI